MRVLQATSHVLAPALYGKRLIRGNADWGHRPCVVLSVKSHTEGSHLYTDYVNKKLLKDKNFVDIDYFSIVIVILK